MEEGDSGYAHVFGLTTVLFGLCFVMSMGVVSVHYPYKPGVAYCGDPPAIAEPGKVVVNAMEALYSCPSDKFRLGGVATRKCNAKNEEKTKFEWEPSQDQASFCLEA